MEKAKQNKKSKEEESTKVEVTLELEHPGDLEIEPEAQIKTMDQACQVDFFTDSVMYEKTFICNTYHHVGNLYNDFQVQTNITNVKSVKVSTKSKLNDENVGTESTTFIDKAVGLFFCKDSVTTGNFAEITSVTDSSEMIGLGGVSLENFEFLFSRLIKKSSANSKLTTANKLFIFLVKIKTGLSFSAIGVLFAIHRTTASRIFIQILGELACVTADLVFWPEKNVVQGTMPACFHPDYSNTRVIIDCTEFRIQVPTSVDNRVYTYSHYKKGFTAKLFVGITPSGFISFKSKLAGGRKSDAQITIESGLLDLLEDGDVVLADKDFPDIRQTIDKTGKKFLLVMPPFLEKKQKFSAEETRETYNIAKVRIHVERIMQRLRTYQILNKIKENLFENVDDIIHVCCVLVNLQPPIFSNKNPNEID